MDWIITFSDNAFFLPVNTDNPTAKIETRVEYDAALAADNVEVKPAEVILPFSYFKQFGFDEWIQENPDFALNDAFMFRRSDGKLVNLKKVAEEDLETFLKTEYENEQVGEGDTFIQQKFKSAGAAIEYINNLRDVTRLVLNRVPTSKTSGGFIGEVIGWINDNGNTVFTSALKNILDGGDYDIDALSVFFKSVGDSGKVIDKGVKGDMNQMFDLLYDYYKDARNAEIYMSPIDLDPLKEQVEEKKAAMTSFNNNHHDWGTNTFYYDNIFEGDKMIGVFANIIKNFSYTTHVIEKLRSQGIQLNQRLKIDEGDSKLIADRLEGYLNAAMDNAKELILGTLGATIEGGNVIGAAAMLNYTYDEITDLLEQEAVKNVFDRIKYSRRISSYKKLTIDDAIEAETENLNTGATDQINELESKLTQLESMIANPETLILEGLKDATQEEDGSYSYVEENPYDGSITAKRLYPELFFFF